jgi:hypothetical protein
MFQLGDFVKHQKTGCFGKVIGYGHEIVDSVYLPTLIVRVAQAAELKQQGFVEDLSSVWMRFERA